MNFCTTKSSQQQKCYDNKDCWQVDREMQDIDCLMNKYMGGVNLADQAMCYYSVGRESALQLQNPRWMQLL